jgi:hypothetical protein
MNPDYFDRHHRQVTWADMFPKPRKDWNRDDPIKQESLNLKDPPIRGMPPSDDDAIELEETSTVAATPAVQSQPIKPLTEVRERELNEQFAGDAAELQRRVEVLVEKRKKASGLISPFLLAEAQELKEIGGQLRQKWEKSEYATDLSTFHRWHSRLTQLRAFLFRAPDAADKLFNDFAYSRKQQIDAAERAERKRLEDLQRQRDEEERKRHSEALKAEGRAEEAKIVEETALPPPAAPPAKASAPIAPGVSVVVSVKLTRIVNVVKLIAWLAKNPNLLMTLFEIKWSGWKTLLTSHYDKKSGEMTLDPDAIGIEIEVSGGARSRKSNGEV